MPSSSTASNIINYLSDSLLLNLSSICACYSRPSRTVFRLIGRDIPPTSIITNSLRGGSTYLYSSGRIVCDDLNCDGGNIGGWTIGEDSISASGTILQSDGNIYTRLGRVGLVEGEDSQGTTYNFGLQATGGSGSVIIQATDGNGNVALRAANYIILNGNRLTCTVPAANQSGIYARFA